ncbi:L-selectin-like [Poeciliopsis prolifica]|uniref:L-selectin-like n=1 Tax=Poeciliopsis prolifica TaxID=188132 RepID=UPI0024146578|nr:L-selectin-like [Poeciliopsis prolifica]
MNWEEAQSFCRDHYTDLAFPRSQAENEEIAAEIPGGVLGWIGFYRESWKWSDGHMYLFQNWLQAKPDSQSELCSVARFSSSGGWDDWNCDKLKPFICHDDPQPFTTQVVKVKLVLNSALDLNDPAVLENMKAELRLMLDQQGPDVKLSWKKQQDGKIFHQEEEEEKLQ